MALLERTIYPRFPDIFSPSHLEQAYTPTPAELAFANQTVRGKSSQLNLLVQLKAFQNLHYFPYLVDVPNAVVVHVQQCLGLNGTAQLVYPSASVYRHRAAIRQYLGVKAYDRTSRHLVVEALVQTARTRDDLADLINVAVETLVAANYELPVFNTVDRMVRRVRHLVNTGYFHKLMAQLTLDQQSALDKLLVFEPIRKMTSFHRLKQIPQSPTITHLKELENHLDWLQGLGEAEKWLEQAGLPLTKMVAFAHQSRSLSLSEVQQFLPAKRYTFLACLIVHARTATRDNLTEMFIRRMAALHQNAKDALAVWREEHRGLHETLLETFTDIVVAANSSRQTSSSKEQNVFEEEEVDNNDESEQLRPPYPELSAEAELMADANLGRQVRQLLQQQGGAEALLEICQEANAYNANNYLPLLPKFYKSHRATLFRLVGLLKIRSATQNVALEQALKLVVELYEQGSRAKWVSPVRITPPTTPSASSDTPVGEADKVEAEAQKELTAQPKEGNVDLSFATELWQKTIRVRRFRKRKYELDRKLLELCVFSYGGVVAMEQKVKVCSWSHCYKA